MPFNNEPSVLYDSQSESQLSITNDEDPLKLLKR